jgi:hypothetical protein
LLEETYTTKELIDQIVRELEDLLAIETDRRSGRLRQVERKEWLLAAVREYIRLTTNSRPDWNTPDDTVKESER